MDGTLNISVSLNYYFDNVQFMNYFKTQIIINLHSDLT